MARPARGEAFDPASLLFAVDAFPPATFDIEFSGWVPTLELTAYVRAVPAPGPVRVLQRAQLIEAVFRHHTARTPVGFAAPIEILPGE